MHPKPSRPFIAGRLRKVFAKEPQDTPATRVLPWRHGPSGSRTSFARCSCGMAWPTLARCMRRISERLSTSVCRTASLCGSKMKEARFCGAMPRRSLRILPVWDESSGLLLPCWRSDGEAVAAFFCQLDLTLALRIAGAVRFAATFGAVGAGNTFLEQR